MESETTLIGNYCKYRRLENGIHEFIMMEASRAAVDDFIKALEYMMQTIPPDTVSTPTLMDSSVGVQPIRYIFSRINDFMRTNGQNTTESNKFALILPNSTLTRTVDMMMRAFPNLNTRIFSPGDREKAITWMLDQ